MKNSKLRSCLHREEVRMARHARNNSRTGLGNSRVGMR